MNKIYKTTTIIVLLYSTVLVLLGCYLSSFVFLYKDSFLQFAFAEFVDTNIWLINWYFFCYLYISSGLIGFFLSLSNWKNTPESCRLWLLFITWQAAISVIQIGSYRIGEPDKYTLSIVGGLFLFSWLTYRYRKIGSFSLFSKKRILEFCVFFVVFTQFSGIIYVNTNKDSHQSLHSLSEEELEKRVTNSLSKGMKEKFLYENYGKNYKKYMEFYAMYEQKNGRETRELGMYLLQNGYSKNKFILMVLGMEQFSVGEISEAINYLNRALEGGYCSEMAKPSSESMIHFENAQIHYMLSVLYTKQKDSEKAKEEYQKSQVLFKKVKQETPSQDLMRKWENMSERAMNHFKRDLKQNPSISTITQQENSGDAKSRAAD